MLQRKEEQLDDQKNNKKKQEEFIPVSNYQTKYQHLIGLETAKEAARKTETNKQYGFGLYFSYNSIFKLVLFMYSIEYKQLSA